MKVEAICQWLLKENCHYYRNSYLKYVKLESPVNSNYKAASLSLRRFAICLLLVKAVFSLILNCETEGGKSELIILLKIDLKMVLSFISLSLSLSCLGDSRHDDSIGLSGTQGFVLLYFFKANIKEHLGLCNRRYRVFVVVMLLI